MCGILSSAKFHSRDYAIALERSAEPDDHWLADSARMKGDVISHVFYCACRNGQTAVTALLLERGADVSRQFHIFIEERVFGAVPHAGEFVGRTPNLSP